MSQIDKAKAAIAKIRNSVNEKADVSTKCLGNEGVTDKQAERIYSQFCED